MQSDENKFDMMIILPSKFCSWQKVVSWSTCLIINVAIKGQVSNKSEKQKKWTKNVVSQF